MSGAYEYCAVLGAQLALLRLVVYAVGQSLEALAGGGDRISPDFNTQF